jgi:uncharacterized protein YndB with AHSA1/START domain
MTRATLQASWQAEDSLVIRASAERIFEKLRDYNNIREWFGLGYSARILGDEPLVDEGSVVEHRILTLSFKRRIEKLEPHKRIVERYLGPNYEGSGIWELEELPDRVKLSYVYDAADTGWQSRLIYRVAGRRAHHRFYSQVLERLKHSLEGESR